VFEALTNEACITFAAAEKDEVDDRRRPEEEANHKDMQLLDIREAVDVTCVVAIFQQTTGQAQGHGANAKLLRRKIVLWVGAISPITFPTP
jgi:hypothetical protein